MIENSLSNANIQIIHESDKRVKKMITRLILDVFYRNWIYHFFSVIVFKGNKWKLHEVKYLCLDSWQSYQC